ncbi:MAG: HD domain-containing protein [Bacteroidales bacterium]|nr:HD domain-containing protein [Bacteroidales bacterium]
MYPKVNVGLKQYVEQEILPRYNHFDSAHKLDHVQKVMAQSMEIAHKLAAAEGSDSGSQLNMDMVYAIAAYHDTGVVEGREHHHTVSGRIIRQDEHLRQWFSETEIVTMAQAAEDHRASAQGEPRSLYGKIVAEADRDIEPTTIVCHTVQYGLSHYPDLDREGHWQRTLQHLNEKYAEGGYLKLFIPCSRNWLQMQKLRQLIADRPRLRTLFDQIMDIERKATDN